MHAIIREVSIEKYLCLYFVIVYVLRSYMRLIVFPVGLVDTMIFDYIQRVFQAGSAYLHGAGRFTLNSRIWTINENKGLL